MSIHDTPVQQVAPASGLHQGDGGGSGARERPLLFSAPMVRATLADLKTKTRRVVKGTAAEWLADPINFLPEFVTDPDNGLCPYGVPGDRLWVRETLKRDPHVWTYAADGAEVGWPARQGLAGKARDTIVSIHMPRNACRLRLRITDVRIERLNDISEEDAQAEGVQEPSLVPMLGAFWSSRDGFARLWEHINGPGSWAANPWVWVISFQKDSPSPTGQGAERTLPETGSSGTPSNIIFPKDQEIDHG